MERNGMGKLSRWALTGMLVLCCGIRAADNQEVALRAAIQKEVVDGDLPGAIRIYETVAAGSDPVPAAQALMRIGRCYERLGDPRARQAYQRVVTRFASQKEAAQEARNRLAALSKHGDEPRVVTGWYNGDWQSGIPGLANWYRQDREFSRVYDNFEVPENGWIVVAAFSDNRMDFEGVVNASWEIREDMSPQSGGKLVASAVSPATQTPIPGNGPFPDAGDLFVGYRIQVDGLRVVLAPGKYWLSVAPAGQGRSYISATRGRNAVGKPKGNDGGALFDSPHRKTRFEKAETVGSGGQLGTGGDFSQEVLILDNFKQ
jgi:hypothetical protein